MSIWFPPLRPRDIRGTMEVGICCIDLFLAREVARKCRVTVFFFSFSFSEHTPDDVWTCEVMRKLWR